MLAPNPFSRIRCLIKISIIKSIIRTHFSRHEIEVLSNNLLQVFIIKYLNKKKQLDTNDINFLWIFILDELYFRHVKNHRLALHCLHTRRFVFLNFNL